MLNFGAGCSSRARVGRAAIVSATIALLAGWSAQTKAQQQQPGGQYPQYRPNEYELKQKQEYERYQKAQKQQYEQYLKQFQQNPRQIDPNSGRNYPAYRGTEQDQQACIGDVFRLCSDSIPDATRIVACLRGKKTSLSPACKAVFARNEHAQAFDKH